jgi:hypothetical protein
MQEIKWSYFDYAHTRRVKTGYGNHIKPLLHSKGKTHPSRRFASPSIRGKKEIRINRQLPYTKIKREKKRESVIIGRRGGRGEGQKVHKESQNQHKETVKVIESTEGHFGNNRGSNRSMVRSYRQPNT